jgi:hypothetical protein
MADYRKIMCIEKIEKPGHVIVCGNNMGDFGLSLDEAEMYCNKCDIAWFVRKTAEGDFAMKKVDRSKRKYNFDGLVVEEK